MKNEGYVFRGKNITTLVLGKIEHVVGLLSEKEQKSFDECYPEFVISRTYRNLVNVSTLLWSESAEFILDDFIRERSDK